MWCSQVYIGLFHPNWEGGMTTAWHIPPEKKSDQLGYNAILLFSKFRVMDLTSCTRVITNSILNWMIYVQFNFQECQTFTLINGLRYEIIHNQITLECIFLTGPGNFEN